MAGIISKSIFVQDGMYMSMLADNDLTLGQVVEYTTTGTDTCDVAGIASGSPTVAGVVVAGNRTSRTQTDATVESGQLATVLTRGVARVYTGTSTILRGSYLEAAATGTVDLLGTTGSATDVKDAIGIALEGNSGSAATIRIKLLRG